MNFLNNCDIEGPVYMLNLLSFKEKAVYLDGRSTELTGRQAYKLYGEQMIPFVTQCGGRLIFSGDPQFWLLGSFKETILSSGVGQRGVLWDSVAIVEYPSKEVFVSIVSDPAQGA